MRYEIRARLDEPAGVLGGSETVWYYNQSPDTLHDFYLHLYLNAFRPGSRWSDRDSIEGRRRFNDLKDPDYGFNHVRDVRMGDALLTPEYPYAPDSTIVRFRLPRAIAPGDSAVYTITWDARPSTVPRRQGRQGRRFDFAEWYPRVVAFDRYGWEDNPLNVAGEFYGEFGIFDVTLDVPADEVIGATGVPIEGDPGWEKAKASPDIAVDLQRTWYDKPNDPAVGRASGCATMTVAAGRKCVRFYAADVHHFAMSFNPVYVYEQGRFNNVVVHVLYQPGDRAEWGNGIAVRREEEALRWLDNLFGPFPWPQITNVHRIEGGGTEFPMMVMNGGADLGLIIHETGHNYVMGILANNEWKEGWLDEGFTSFQTSWYFEEHQRGSNYHGLESFMLDLDLGGWSEPVSTPGHLFSDFTIYNLMTYSKAELFYDQIRTIVGTDVMRQILREYYRRYALKHVDERAFLETAEDVSGKDLKPLFAQWLHGTPLYDYAIGDVRRKQLADGSWQTSVEVKRKGDGIYPVQIGERVAGGAVAYARADGRPLTQTVTFHTPERPGPLMLDPFVQSHDWNFLNNYEGRPFGAGRIAWRLDDYVTNPAARDHEIQSIAPTAWYNDVGGLTVGVRNRANYLGRFGLAAGWAHVALGHDTLFDRSAWQRIGLRWSLANPPALRSANTTESLALWSEEGVAGGRINVETRHQPSLDAATVSRRGWTVEVMDVTAESFRDPTRWAPGGSAELQHYHAFDLATSHATWHYDLALAGGITWFGDAAGSRLSRAVEAEPYGRFTATAFTHGHHHGPFELNGRVFGALYLARHAPLPQRAVPVSGADPYQSFANVFVRTPGALFVRPDVFYHSPGNGDLRGYAGALGGRGLVAANLEVELPLVMRERGVLRGASLVLFGDGGLVDSLAVPSTSGNFYTPLADAGAGARLQLHVGDLSFPLRFELPLWVSRPALAQDTKNGVSQFQFRWLFSLEQSF